MDNKALALLLIGLGFALINKKSFAKTSVKASTSINTAVRIDERYIKDRMLEIYNRYGFTFPIKLAFVIVKSESNFKPYVKNKHSSAYGLFQMINSTFEWSYKLCKRKYRNCSLNKNDIDNQILLGFTLIQHYWNIFKNPYKVLLAWCSPAEAYGKITKYHNYCKKITQIKWRLYNVSV